MTTAPIAPDRRPGPPNTAADQSARVVDVAAVEGGQSAQEVEGSAEQSGTRVEGEGHPPFQTIGSEAAE